MAESNADLQRWLLQLLNEIEGLQPALDRSVKDSALAMVGSSDARELQRRRRAAETSSDALHCAVASVLGAGNAIRLFLKPPSQRAEVG